MKFLHRWLLAISLVPLLAPVAPAFGDYAEGIEYERIVPAPPHRASAKVEVVEVFWYGCPHCFHFDPIVAKWLEQKPSQVQFVRMPAAVNPHWALHAHAFYALQSLGALEKLHLALFKAIHEDHITLGSIDQLAEFCAKHGVNGPDFRKAMESDAVKKRVERARESTARWGVSGVPMMVVNGKYRTGAEMAGGNEEVLKVVDYLVAKESASNQ